MAVVSTRQAQVEGTLIKQSGFYHLIFVENSLDLRDLSHDTSPHLSFHERFYRSNPPLGTIFGPADGNEVSHVAKIYMPSNPMTYDKIRKELCLSVEHDCWRAEFAQSDATFGMISKWISSETRLRNDCALASLGTEITANLLQNAPTFSGHISLLRLLAHVHYLLFQQNGKNLQGDEVMPVLPGCLGAAADLFYLYVFLSGIPKLLERHRRRGIPLQVTTETLSDLHTRVRDYQRRTGRWGLDTRAWLLHHYSGNLIGLGRLQFQLFTFPWPFKLYVHRDGRRSMALALTGEQFRDDGQFANADKGERGEEAWTSALVEEAGSVRGYPVEFETGKVTREVVTLDRSVWTEALTPGDPVLAAHISASGPLDPAACRESFARVEDFFSRHYPDWPFKAVTCATWLLDPQFANHLKPDSNIVRFLRLFDLLPYSNASDDQLFERVFDNEKKPLDELPVNTSLRRAILAHMRRGNRWRTGSGVILRSHLPGREYSG